MRSVLLLWLAFCSLQLCYLIGSYNMDGLYDSTGYDYRAHSQQLRERFDEMKQDFAEGKDGSGSLYDVLAFQDEMIKVLESSGDFLSSIGLSGRGHSGYGHYYYGYERRYHNEFYDFDSEKKHNANLNLYIDVVFVGYPASALKVIKENWFDNLGRKDDFMVKVAPFGDVISSSAIDGGAFGETTISYHFNLVQISFQVADVIRNRVNLFSRNRGDHSEINAWEMEATLESLAAAISATHTKNLTISSSNPFSSGSTEPVTVRPTATIFVLNLDLHQDGKSANAEAFARHKYRPGFAEEELKALATNAEIVKACEEVLSSRNPPSATSDVSKPLNIMVEDILSKRIDAPPNRYRGYYDYIRNEEDKTFEGVNWRDAKQETRKWANAFDEETAVLASSHLTIQKQALRYLKASQHSPLSRFRHELASSILEKQAETSRGNSYYPSGTWVGSNRLLWKDMNAITDLPCNRERRFFHTSSAITPRPLNETEWLKIGDHNPYSMNRNVKEEIVFLTKAIKRRYETSSKLYEESMCKEWLPEELRTMGTRSSVQHIEAVLGYINRAFEVDFSVDSCSYLSFELAFIDAVLTTGIELTSLYDIYLSQANAGDYKDFVRESLHLLLKTLSTSIDFSNVFLDGDALSKTQTGTGDTHVSILSEDAVAYLSYLASTVLDLTRQFIAPPMQLRQHRGLVGSASNSRHLSKSGISQQHLVSESLSDAAALLPPRLKDQFLYLNNSGIPAYNDWQNLFDFVVRLADEDDKSSTTTSSSVEAPTAGRHHFAGTSSKAYLEGCSADTERMSDQAAIDETTSHIHNLVHWTLAYPAVVAPTKIDVSIYVIKLQDSFDPLGVYSGDPWGFDIITLKEEIMRLALPNQEMGISTYQFRSTDEPALAVGLHSCGRHSSSEIGTHSGDNVYLNVHCVLSFVEHYDEETYAPYADDLKAHQNANGDFKSKHYKSSLHVPIYLLSTDSEKPVYLDGNRQVSTQGNSIIVVQNKHVQLPSPLSTQDETNDDQKQSNQATDKAQQLILGRNPIGPTLQAIANVIGGLPPSMSGHKGTQTSLALLSSLHNLENHLQMVNGDSQLLLKAAYCTPASLKSTLSTGIISVYPNYLLDWTKAIGNSPQFDASTAKIPRFSELDIEFIHRSRVLRAISSARALAQEEIAAFRERSQVGAIDAKLHGKLGGPYDTVLVFEIVEAYEHRFNNMIDQALYFASIKSWADAIAFANAIYFVAVYAVDYLKVENALPNEEEEELLRAQFESEMSGSSTGSDGQTSWLGSFVFIVVSYTMWPAMACGLAFAAVKLVLQLSTMKYLFKRRNTSRETMSRLTPTSSSTYRYASSSGDSLL